MELIVRFYQMQNDLPCGMRLSDEVTCGCPDGGDADFWSDISAISRNRLMSSGKRLASLILIPAVP
jgi:hypothetical protein